MTFLVIDTMSDAAKQKENETFAPMLPCNDSIFVSHMT